MGAGTQSVTGVDFQPDFLMYISTDHATLDTTDSTVAQVSVGFASGSAAQAGIGTKLNTSGGTPTATFVRQRTDNAIVELTNTGVEAKLMALQSFEPDGFTLNKTSCVDATVIHYLALKGGNYKVGSFNKSTAAAPFTDASSLL